jgi:hypothetical protein
LQRWVRKTQDEDKQHRKLKYEQHGSHQKPGMNPTDQHELNNLHRRPSKDDFYQVSIHLTSGFRVKDLFRNRPIRKSKTQDEDKQHRKLKYEQHGSHQKPGMNPTVTVSYKTPSL